MLSLKILEILPESDHCPLTLTLVCRLRTLTTQNIPHRFRALDLIPIYCRSSIISTRLKIPGKPFATSLNLCLELLIPHVASQQHCSPVFRKQLLTLLVALANTNAKMQTRDGMMQIVELHVLP